MARDPYRYFRVEAREILESLGRAVLALERGASAPELVADMLRLAHTLKGAAHVVGRADIAAAAHAMEETLSGHRHTAPGAVPREHIEQLLRLLDDMAGTLATLASPAEAHEGPSAAAPAAPAASGAGDPPIDDVRVDGAQVDGVLEEVLEAEMSLAGLGAGLEELESARSLAAALVASASSGRSRVALEGAMEQLQRAQRRLHVALDDCTHAVEQVRSRAGELRLVPAGAVFAALERSVRDAARSVGNKATLETSGGEHRLEADVLSALRDALLHVVRIAVAHGIEPPAERLARGKPETGGIRLAVRRRGGRIAFTCTDDGRGIDTAAVRRAAIAMGVVGAEQGLAMADAEVERLALESGVTTTSAVGAVAGRGIGLDVVRATALRLNGEVSLS
ncbi:MAG: Hpt domain-containing protein, partial [Polyangiaceae bacterium]